MTSNGKEDQDQRKILGMEDSSMTIEFLRARLLAERSVSQTARQRADELAERVLELEEQLKIVSLQRKKAERATEAVLSILENQEISDASEEFDSGSDSKGAESTDNRNERKPTSSNVKEKENDAETFSSSEIVSSPSTGRSLSWKSGKLSLQQSFDRKKYTDSAWRRSSSFGSSGTSLPKQAGKSCRQIRRSSTKSATNELQNTSVECPSEVLPSSANNGHQSLTDSAGNNDVKDQLHFPASEMSENQRKGDESDENMERALQHKAQLIGQYEAEEKAQREWEEKYRENNSYAQDSCDPGNYSDVTEERDDVKAFQQPYSDEMTNLQNHANNFQEADIPSTNLEAGQAFEGAYEQALVSRDASDNIGTILGALEQAKFSLNQQINVSPVEKGEHSIPTNRIEDRLGVPPGCPGLFRLPTDIQLEATTIASYQGLPSQRPILENTLGTGFDYLNPPSSLGLPFSSKSTYPTYPFFPNTTTITTSQSQASWSPLYESSLTTFCPVVVPNLSSGEEVCLRSLLRNETGIPPSVPVSHYDAHLRQNMYR